MVDLARLYAKHARRFDEIRVQSRMEEPYLHRACEVARAPGSVLDLGCGSGEPIARFFVECGYRLTGVDLVGEMLDLCRQRLPDMTWLQADMRSIDLAREFDIVVAWDSFFHLPPNDQRAMFEVFQNHTRVGGALVFTSGTREEEAIGGDLFGDPLYHASLDTAEYRELLGRHAFEVIQHSVEDPECGGHTVWIAHRVA